MVGVNIAPSLIGDRDFPQRITDCLTRYDLEPHQLVLEITEEALLEDLEVAKQVTRELGALGVRLSLDDFGTGYSSLVHLQQIPLHSLKIDQAFSARIDTDPAAERFAAALLALGRDLGLIVVAEGIERAAQAEVLRRLGCPLVQGYLFGRPVSAAEITPLLTRTVPVAT